MNRSILMIADPENLHFYRSLQIPEERSAFRSFLDCDDFSDDPRFGLIILDCGLHLERGINLLKAIKSMCPRTPVIFVTDVSSEASAVRAFRAGARDYFRRPFRVHELLEAVERIIHITNGAKEQRIPYRVEASARDQEIFGKLMTDIPVQILRVLRYIENNLYNNISLSDLAEEAHLSKFHFSRLFKTHVGMSPKQFVTKMRIETAKSLLMKNDVSISSVATTVGFNDPGNFERHFKKLTGVTPSSFANFQK